MTIAPRKSVHGGTKHNNIFSMSRFFPDLLSAPRIGFFFVAVAVLLLASGISGVGFVLNSAVFLIGGAIVWIAWFVLMLMIAAPGLITRLEKYRIFIRRLAISIFMILFVMGTAELVALLTFNSIFTQSSNHSGLSQSLKALNHGFHYNDATALAHQAVENLIHGKNPYANANIVTALLENNSSYDRVTPLRVGRFANQFPYPDNQLLKQVWDEAIKNPQNPPIELETKLNYPAGSFLIPAPFFLAGIKDIRIVYAIVVLAGCISAMWLLPRDRRLIFLGVALISLEIWNSIASGETGTLALPFLLLAWMLARKHPWQSAVFMGVAIATKQTTWFFFPFYLIYTFRIVGIKKLMYLSGIIAAIFVAMNLPFAIYDMRLWFSSLTAPMTESIFPIGVGLITLVTGRVLDIQSPLIFTICEFSVFIVCIVWYLRYGRRYPYTAPVLAVLPLFFAWRSLWTYFFYMDLIVFALILMNEKIKLIPGLHARSGDNVPQQL